MLEMQLSFCNDNDAATITVSDAVARKRRQNYSPDRRLRIPLSNAPPHPAPPDGGKTRGKVLWGTPEDIEIYNSMDGDLYGDIKT
jgi:hypothetical protein